MYFQTCRPFHLIIKPVGAACNLVCHYCHYLEKAALYPRGTFRMDDETLARVTEAYLQTHPGKEVTFSWSGGEPLLMGRDFFQRALMYQRKFARPGQRVVNALQTNGTLIDNEWASFFADNQFLIAVSVDGPPDLHDRYRLNREGRPTYTRVISGLNCLLRYRVECNALVAVNHLNVTQPERVYLHLTNLGFDCIQFLPIVERETPTSRRVKPYSVNPEQYGEFLCTVFDYWARHDVDRIFIQVFESALNVWLGRSPSVCVFSSSCGLSPVVEHTGDLYACDHFMTRRHKRGQVSLETLRDMVEGSAQRDFALEKSHFSIECRRCPVALLCGGDCPKHRIRVAKDGKPISYLCPAYLKFFTHSAPILQAMAVEIRAGRSAKNVMERYREVAHR